MLSVENLQVELGGRTTVDDLDLMIERGQWLALLGLNGSGKSTLIRAITGQLGIAAGHVTIDGINLTLDPVGAKRRLGYAVPAEALPPDLSAAQYLDVIASIRGTPVNTLADLIEVFGLSAAWHDPIATYSLGMRQKTGILGALLGTPGLLIFDESLSGLDPISAWHCTRWLSDRVQAGQCAVLMATHDLAFVSAYCDRAALLAGGQLIRRYNLDPSSLSDSGVRREHGGTASRNFDDFEAHSGAM